MIDMRHLLILVLSQKVCTRCGATKDLSEFYSNKLGTLGRQAHCKVCESRRKKNSYAAGKMEIGKTEMGIE